MTLRDGIASWLQGRGFRQWLPGEFDVDRLRAWIGQRGAVEVCRADGMIVAAVAVLWDDPIWPDGDRDAGYVHLLMVDRDELYDTTLFEKQLSLLPPPRTTHPDVADVEAFLTDVVAWAEKQTDVEAVGLAGSWARAAARLDSDVDLVIIVDDVDQRLVDDRWLARFGDVATATREDWGAVQSWRVRYRSGLEIEYGLTTSDWLRTPLDEGTATVIADGFLALYDPQGRLSAVLNQVAAT